MSAPEPDAESLAAAETRIVELEIRSAYQEQRLVELDDVLREFADRVVALERQLAELREQLTQEPGSPIGPADDPPPHY
ncbi:MAG: SlyX family protein [Myxococcales bacterium]|nr:SlyX family protein [Myxococcales bacterium]MCB9754062.1 SlyX family protein [Myxococcales bacterium]